MILARYVELVDLKKKYPDTYVMKITCPRKIYSTPESTSKLSNDFDVETYIPEISDIYILTYSL